MLASVAVRRKLQGEGIWKVLELFPDHIFAQLGSTRAILLTATVSKQWYQVVRCSLHSINCSVSTTEQAQQLAAFLQAGTLSQLHIVNFTSSVTAHAPQSRRPLQAGRRTSTKNESNSSSDCHPSGQLVLKALLYVAPTLRQLRLHLQQPDVHSLQMLLHAATQLTALHITMPPVQGLHIPQTVRQLTWRQPAEVHSRLQQGTSSSSSIPLPPLLHLSALTALDLSACLHDKQCALPALPLQLKTLSITDMLAQQLSSLQTPGLPALTSLHVHFVRSTDPEWLRPFQLPVLQQLQSLRKLVLSGHHGVLRPAQATASQHTQVLAAAPATDDAAVARHAGQQQPTALPNQLQHLSIGYIPSISAVTHLTALTALEVGAQEDLQPNCDVLSDARPAVKRIYVPDRQNLLQHIATQLPLLQQLSLHANWGRCRPLQLEQLAALQHLTALHLSGDYCRVCTCPGAALPQSLQQLHIDTSGCKLGLAEVALPELVDQPGQAGTGALSASVLGVLSQLTQLKSLTLRGAVVGPAPWPMLSQLPLTRLDVGGVQHRSASLPDHISNHGDLLNGVQRRVDKILALVDTVRPLLPGGCCSAAAATAARLTRSASQQALAELLQHAQRAQHVDRSDLTLRQRLLDYAARFRERRAQQRLEEETNYLDQQVAQHIHEWLHTAAEGFLCVHAVSVERQLGTVAAAFQKTLCSTCPLFVPAHRPGAATGSTSCASGAATSAASTTLPRSNAEQQEKNKNQGQLLVPHEAAACKELMEALQQLTEYYQWVKQSIRVWHLLLGLVRKGQHLWQVEPMLEQLLQQVEHAAAIEADTPPASAYVAMQKLLQEVEQYSAAVDTALGLPGRVFTSTSGVEGFERLIGGLSELQQLVLTHPELQTVWWQYSTSATVAQAVVRELKWPALRAARKHEPLQVSSSTLDRTAHSRLTSLVICADAVLRKKTGYSEQALRQSHGAVQDLLQWLPLLANLSSLRLVPAVGSLSTPKRWEWPGPGEAKLQLQEAIEQLRKAMPWCRVWCDGISN